MLLVIKMAEEVEEQFAAIGEVSYCRQALRLLLMA